MRPSFALSLVPAALVVGLLGCGSVDAPITDAAVDAIDAQTTCVPACGANATCTGTTCGCDPGYSGDGLVCADVNECAANNGGCAADATCTNTPGSRTCACGPGFVGDGLTCRPVWQRIASVPGPAFDGGFGANVAAVGARIYFANDGDNASTIFRYFDLNSLSASANLALPAGAQDFCACGFTQTFVADGTFIWMFGNEGQRYDTAANRWTAVSTYSSNNPAIGRGESAGVFDPQSGRVLLIGGRDFNNNNQPGAVAFAPAAQSFSAEPGQAAFSINQATAWAMPGTGRVYVAGGSFGDGNARHLVRHDVGTAVWQTLPDAPVDLQPRGMGHLDATTLWVADNSRLYFFDTSANAWWPQGVDVPPNFQRAVTAAGSVYAITSTATGVEFYKLINAQ